MNKIKIIAFYLPQFHPFKENDEWWGKGFTEWTNVANAKPLFKGHVQPKIPGDLGFYDLRIPSVRQIQADLAKSAGIYGFCYWHYWFDSNNHIMHNIFDEVLSSGKPNFPFCLGWANHSWFAKTWNKDVPDKLLIEQKYLGIEDFMKHFDYAYKAFIDPRYIFINEKPVYYIFDPKKIPSDFISMWNKWAVDKGLKGVCFIGRMVNPSDEPELMQKGFSYLVPERINAYYSNMPVFSRYLFRFFKLFSLKPKFCFSYKKVYKTFINPAFDSKENIIPALIPQWDHSPRSGRRGTILYNSSPSLFRKHIQEALNVLKLKKNKILFLKSWNEWAEGNYMEPDIKFRSGYIEVLSNELRNESTI